MDAVLLSDQIDVKRSLETALSGLGERVRLRWAPMHWQSGHPAQAQADLIFVDLAWCGLPALPQLSRAVRETWGDAPLVVLLDSPDEVARIAQTDVEADLLVAKCASPGVVRRSMRRYMSPQPA